MKVCHFTSAHPQEDIRIFHKECVSLVSAGYDVYEVSCGKTYDNKGVHVIGIGAMESSRFKRMTKTVRKIYSAALAVDADVYHFHDPELLPYGLKLKKKGKKVIFDSHEDVPAQIQDKPWIPKPFRKLVSSIYRSYENGIIKRLDAVVAATPYIADTFKGRCANVAVVNNYPRLDDIKFHTEPFADKERIICYAGGINEDRGEKIMIDAMDKVDGTLLVAGDHEALDLNSRVKYIGMLGRDGVNDLYGRAVVGLCILKPIKNYVNSQPIKMYEYMAAGLPFICSDFPAWRKVAEASGGGICVDPYDITSIASNIETLLSDRELAQKMGVKGREYVISNCNWSNEEKSLLMLYNIILGKETNTL